jgi:hypothetical protein
LRSTRKMKLQRAARSGDHTCLLHSGNCAILLVRTNRLSGQGGIMNRTGRATVSLMLLVAAFSLGTRQAQAQIQPQTPQNPAASVLSQIQAANEGCRRKYPEPIKQAIDYTTCENRNMELLRPSMVYPDLMDQELANNLMLAEKVQKGKMTPIEMKAIKAQLHSQIVSEFQRRQLAKMATTSRPTAPVANTTGFVASPSAVQAGAPQLQNPPQQSTPPKEPHCQTARFGMMLETVCN